MSEEHIDVLISEEMLRELHQVSIYIGTPNHKDLIKKYIERGLRRDKEKMEAARKLSLDRQKQINEITLLLKKTCPHCQHELSIIETSSFSRWQGELLGVCTSDDCCYFRNSWDVMRKQGNHAGYRYYRDAHGCEGALAIGPIDRFLDG
jgi:hypothetical protein